jgi:hypothetical protein
MLDLFNTAKPQNCDIQIFYGGAATNDVANNRTWMKPRGVSHVYMLLIGAGANGVAGTRGGGSGAVTTWYGAAQHVPDICYVRAGAGGGASGGQSTVFIKTTTTGSYTLLEAFAGSTGTGGAVMTANYFTASGFFQSVAGQDGATTNQTASATTFLSGGAQSQNNDVVANYGYETTQNDGAAGFFLLQPIIVGVAGGGIFNGGIGCGGGGATSPAAGLGGPGLVLIASW